MSNSPNSSPLVSICIPAYNGEDFIEEAIACARQQTYPFLEIIITDDCSTDATLAIAQKAAAADERIKIFSNKVNQGLIGNWQSCVHHSNGAWIKFLFQDDTMEPACVEDMIQTAMQHQAKVCICTRRFIIHEQAHPGLKRFFEQDIIIPQQLFAQTKFYTPAQMALVLTPHLHRNVLGEPSTWLLHKEVFEQGFAFNKRMSQLMDYEFLMNAVLMNGLTFIRKELVAFRVHHKSESNRNVNDAANADLKKIIRAHTGDYMEMIIAALQQPLWQPLLQAWGTRRLRIFFDRLYMKACRDYGEQPARDALHHTLSAAPFTTKPYSFFRYLVNKVLFKFLIKPKLAKHVIL